MLAVLAAARLWAVEPQWVSLGPHDGNGPIGSIAPHPTVVGTLYIGTPGGGVWKTTDAGGSWVPLTDSWPDMTVGAIAIAPSDPSILYAGTKSRVEPSSGDGSIQRSTDGGATWAPAARPAAITVDRISVHPVKPQELVLSGGSGVYRSTDGAASWTGVLLSGGSAGDLQRDPGSPDVLYATTYRYNSLPSVWKSTDGGATWTAKNNGLSISYPSQSTNSNLRRIALAISPSSPAVVYAASLSATTGYFGSRIFRSTDGAESWSELTGLRANPAVTRYYLENPAYANELVVSPASPDAVFAGGESYVRTTDGGATFSAPAARPPLFVHDLAYQGTTLYAATDLGLWASTDGGNTFAARNAGLTIGRYFSVAGDPVHRERVLAGSQDSGVNQRVEDGTWRDLLREHEAYATFCAVNPLMPELAYFLPDGTVMYRTQDAGAISPLVTRVEVQYATLLRRDASSPFTIYTSDNARLLRTTDGGESWSKVWVFPAYPSDIAVSRSDPRVLLMAMWDVYRSTDSGATWTYVRNGLPENYGVQRVEIDPVNPGIAYAALDDSYRPALYRTTDGGASWTVRSSGLPLAMPRVVRVHPRDSSVVLCGTDAGLFRSTDAGGSWARYGIGLPSAPVHDVDLLEDGTLIRVATRGRGIWELRQPTANTPPSAVLTSPSSAMVVAVGQSLRFTGTLADSDGDSLAGSWMFSDSAEVLPVAAGDSAVTHTFRRPGVFRAGLAARDVHGAVGSASVLVTVLEAGDDCAAPRVVPAAGPFPYTVPFRLDPASAQASDPPICGAASPAVWLEFTPETSGSYEVTTLCHGAPCPLAVFTGPRCGPYQPVDCSTARTDTFSPGPYQAATVVVQAQAGQPLRIAVRPDASYPAPSATLLVQPSRTTPVVYGMAPGWGPVAGGTRVRMVVGDGAGWRTGVTFGGAPAQVLASDYADSVQDINVISPPHAPGLVDVTVSYSDGSSATLHDAFLYVDPAAGSGSGFFPLPPCRAVDTRNSEGELGGPALAANATRSFKLTGACGLPSNASTVSANLTVVGPAASGELVVYPGDSPKPVASSISFAAGTTRANNARVMLATDGSGTVNVFNGSDGPLHVLLDVSGYFQ